MTYTYRIIKSTIYYIYAIFLFPGFASRPAEQEIILLCKIETAIKIHKTIIFKTLFISFNNYRALLLLLFQERGKLHVSFYQELM